MASIVIGAGTPGIATSAVNIIVKATYDATGDPSDPVSTLKDVTITNVEAPMLTEIVQITNAAEGTLFTAPAGSYAVLLCPPTDNTYEFRLHSVDGSLALEGTGIALSMVAPTYMTLNGAAQSFILRVVPSFSVNIRTYWL